MEGDWRSADMIVDTQLWEIMCALFDLLMKRQRESKWTPARRSLSSLSLLVPHRLPWPWKSDAAGMGAGKEADYPNSPLGSLECLTLEAPSKESTSCFPGPELSVHWRIMRVGLWTSSWWLRGEWNHQYWIAWRNERQNVVILWDCGCGVLVQTLW